MSVSHVPILTAPRRYLTRAHVAKALKAGLVAGGWTAEEHSSHPLRSGGAVSLAATGLGCEVIAVFGRWSSDALLRYLQLQQHTLRKAALGMAGVTKHKVARRGHAGLRRDTSGTQLTRLSA